MALTALFFASFAEELWLFMALYGAFNGIGCGMCYMIPLVCSWEYFPNNQGMITGIVVALGCLCLMAEASRRVFASSKNIPLKTVVSKDVVARYQEPTNIIHCRLREGDQWNSTHRLRHTCTLSSRTGLSGGHVEAVVCCFRGPRLGVPARWIGRGGRAATGRCPGADCADENVACASAADHFEYLCE